MDPVTIAILVLLEGVGLAMIWRMWAPGRRSLVARCLWTVVLLVPLFGPLFYAFAGESPEAHGERLPEYPDPGAGHF